MQFTIETIRSLRCFTRVATASLACLFVFASIASAENMIYWTDQGTDQVHRAALDGTGIETLADAASLGISTDLRGITVDPLSGTVYFNTQYRHICRVGLDGSNPELLFQADKSYGNKFREMAVDPVGGDIYWVAFTNSGGVCRTDLDFTDIAVELLADGYNKSIGLDIDPSAGKIYWTTVDDGTIYRANLDGTGVEPLITGLVTPRGLELDVDGGKIYWVDAQGDDPLDGIVQSANLDGTDVQTLVTGEDEVTGLAVDPEGGRLYWTDVNAGSIRTSNLDGSDVRDFYTGTAPQFLAIGPAVAVPEPSTIALVLLGLLAGVVRRRR